MLEKEQPNGDHQPYEQQTNKQQSNHKEQQPNDQLDRKWLSEITSPSVTDKGVEDSTNSTLEDGGGFTEVLEEWTESDVARRPT